MKMTHLITSLEGGGTENFLHQILDRSPQNISHEVLYLKKDGPIGQRIRQMQIPVQHVPDFMGLWRHLKDRKPDVLHTLLFRAHQVGRVIGHLAGVTVIVSSQRSIDAWASPVHKQVDGWTLRFCQAVMANSDTARFVVEKRRGARPTPSIFVLPNGVDMKRFPHHAKDEARRLLRLPENVLIGGSLMRLHSEKGADLIPQFAERLLNENPDLHLAVAGVGPLQESLRAEMDKKPWASRFHWVGWTDRAALFLSALDFFWLLSREESFPQALLEASIMGLPWLAPEVSGVAELRAAGAIEMPQTGFMAQLHGLGAQARSREASLRERYDLDVMARRFYEWISSVKIASA